MPSRTDTGAHKMAIDQLGFVHEWLPTSDSNNGRWFVPGDQFGTEVTLRVDITDQQTIMYVLEDGDVLYTAVFHPSTPGNVLNQAVVAAQQALAVNEDAGDWIDPDCTSYVRVVKPSAGAIELAEAARARRVGMKY